MKIIHLLYSILLATAFFSCVNDLGNYDYRRVEEIMGITISGFEDTTVIFGETLEIKPIIENMEDESRYEHLWYVTKVFTGGFLPTRDTLSLERDLSSKIEIDAGDYYLIYIIRDRERDVYARREVEMTVQGTQIGAGWYILKELNNETDFDYINPNSDLMITDVLRDHAFRQDFVDDPPTKGGMQLKGKPVKIIYQSSRYYHQPYKQDGTSAPLLSAQKVLHILSDQDIKTFNASNLYLFKDVDDIFYEKPETIYPQNILEDFGNIFLINDGKLHTIYGMSQNIGKQSYPKIYESNYNYKLHSNLIYGYLGCLFYDTDSRTFLLAASAGSTLNETKEDPTSPIPSLTNIADYDLVRILQRNSGNTGGYKIEGYALFRSTTDTEQYYLAYFYDHWGEGENPFISLREIPKSAQMPTSNVLAVPQSASCIYYGKGSELHIYRDYESAPIEELAYTFPAGEVVSHISNIQSGILTVLTNSISGWKLYGFKIIESTPDIESEPDFLYPKEGYGNGRAHSLMKRD